MTRLLIDTDAFCKLGVSGVLRDAMTLLGADLQECGRLPALPHMLRRGRLRKLFGAEACDALIPIADMVPVATQAGGIWLDKLTSIHAIDPGEAQIFAAAAEAGLAIVSGDKRALRALKEIEGFADALAGRIVVLEAILFALCHRLGLDEMRCRVQPLVPSDRVVQICFSTGNPDPREALRSYYDSLVAELAPLHLWDPLQRSET